MRNVTRKGKLMNRIYTTANYGITFVKPSERDRWVETWAANWNEAREKHGKCWNSQTGAGNDGKQITKINKKSVSHDNVEVRATRPAWGNKSSRTDVREKNHAVRRMPRPWVSQETWLPCTAADCSHSWILHHFLFIRSPPSFFSLSLTAGNSVGISSRHTSLRSPFGTLWKSDIGGPRATAPGSMPRSCNWESAKVHISVNTNSGHDANEY